MRLSEQACFGKRFFLMYNQGVMLNDKKENNTPNPSNPIRPDYRKYDDTTGEFGTKELGYSLWFVKHKLALYRIVVALLIMFSATFWGVSLFKWVFYGGEMLSNKEFEGKLTEFENYGEIQKQFSPEQLIINSTNIFPGGENKFDLVSEVKNPNLRFLAKLKYYYIIGGATTTLQEMVLLPGEENFIAALGVDGSGLEGSNALLQIVDLEWERLSPHVYKNPQEWQNERLNFEVGDFSFSNQMTQSELKVNRIFFILKNSSPFSFKEPKFYIALYDNETLVGIMHLQTPDFRSLEEKKIDLRNFVANLQVQSVKVFPLINLYDQSIYLQPNK